jgi:hypothetical protein
MVPEGRDGGQCEGWEREGRGEEHGQGVGGSVMCACVGGGGTVKGGDREGGGTHEGVGWGIVRRGGREGLYGAGCICGSLLTAMVMQAAQ